MTAKGGSTTCTHDFIRDWEGEWRLALSSTPYAYTYAFWCFLPNQEGGLLEFRGEKRAIFKDVFWCSGLIVLATGWCLHLHLVVWLEISGLGSGRYPRP